MKKNNYKMTKRRALELHEEFIKIYNKLAYEDYLPHEKEKLERQLRMFNNELLMADFKSIPPTEHRIIQ